MRISLIILTSLFITSLTAQPLNRSTPETMLKVAEEKYEAFDYYNALDWYEKYYDETKDKTVAYRIAELHLMLRDYKKAESAWSRLVSQDERAKEAKYPDARLTYGRIQKMNEKYDEAIETLSEYARNASDPAKKQLALAEIEGAKYAKTLKPVEGLAVVNAKSLNTVNAEYSPSMTNSGELYFTAYRQDDVIVLDGKQGDYQSKVFMAQKSGAGFSEPQPITTEVNREDFEHGNVFVTRDGKVMYFTRAVLNGNVLNESKIYYSVRSGSDWGPANEVKGINGNYIAKQPAMGELFGKDVIFFVSNMEGGKGGWDIFYATRKSDGEFSDPVNLGTAINTPGDEETPFYRDGKLYFSSNGYPTMGGLDVFSSTWNGSEWSKPQNMGFGYNSPADDMYFSIDDKGYNGFVVSNRTGTNSIKSKTCCDDIWQITITPPVVDLRALTFEKDKALNGTTLQLVEMTGGAMGKTESKTNTAANLFNFPLDFERSYAILTNKEGYYPDTTYFNTQGLSKTTTINKEIRLRPLPPPQPITVYDTIEIAINEPIRLENIYYDYDKWDILPDAAEELRFMDTLMKTYPDMVIELSSHTDSRGNDPYNMTLSQKRAESAKNYLVSQGVNADRIRAVGYGESVILNQCANGVECTDEEHRFNRRTEFKIVAGPTSIKMVKREVKSKVIPAPGSKAPAPKTGGKTGGGDSVKQQKGASITFDKNSIDFGKFKRGEERKHIFTFTNNGTEDVEVDIVSACDCTEVDWTRSLVKPGESGKIEMTFYSERLKDDELGEVDRELTIVLKNTHPVSGYPLVYETKFHAVVTK